MKKADAEMRAEFKRSDFAKLERGKFFEEFAKADETARTTDRSMRTTGKRTAV